MRTNFFKVIGYNDDTQVNAPKTRPDATMECQRFRAYLRKLDFLNPMSTKTSFESLGGEYKLSDQLKNFSNLAKKSRKEYIIEVFYKKNPVPPFRPIPITQQESMAQENESKMTKIEILCKIEFLLEKAGESVRQKYREIGSKKRNELLNILRKIQNLQSENDVLDNN